MRRRVPLPEPVAGSATWSRRCAGVAALLAIAAVALGRNGLAQGRAGIAVLAAALVLALLGLGLAMRAAVVIWQQGWRGIGQALAGSVLAGFVLVYPGYLAWTAARLPPLSDVSTDLVSPPSFSASPKARTGRDNSVHDDPSAATREGQRGAYPALQPVILDVDPAEAFELVMRLVTARHWRIVEAIAPQGPSGIGHVDAVARTAVMAFPADVTVRIRAQTGQTRIDIRSASRLEPHDIGSNAARIEALAEELQNAE